MADTGGDIIIKGGSCEISFDDGLYYKLDNDPSTRKLKHDSYLVKRIAIKDDDGTFTFTRDFPKGFKGEIRITCLPEDVPAKK